MHKLTKVVLDNGEMALYLDGYYLGSEDDSGDHITLDEIATALQKVPGISVQDVTCPCPDQQDWSWYAVAGEIFTPAVNNYSHREVTVEAFMSRLSAYPADTLCCGTFWLDEDFLEVDETLTPGEIRRAMEIATEHHDANIGYNWDSLRYAAELAKE
ncbi:hypothetical protein [Rahnella sp. GSA61A]|jgi:hypothetical protein|uniref:hypothetical protein n=1 Tax=Rahnella sp. GSA61A TaxID=2862678 RepID=UPI001CBCA8F2|nr:hypothetical protein [Rahnella sp. GSA61A]